MDENRNYDCSHNYPLATHPTRFSRLLEVIISSSSRRRNLRDSTIRAKYCAGSLFCLAFSLSFFWSHLAGGERTTAAFLIHLFGGQGLPLEEWAGDRQGFLDLRVVFTLVVTCKFLSGHLHLRDTQHHGKGNNAREKETKGY